MRVVLVLGGLTILVSMGLALIVFGQSLTEAKLTLAEPASGSDAEGARQPTQGEAVAGKLAEGAVRLEEEECGGDGARGEELTEEEGKKKTEVEACQAEKKPKEEVLAPIQKEQSDIEATFKTEKEAWTGEITTLKQQLEQRSKVCGFVKDSTDTATLCPPKEGAAKAETAPVQGQPASTKAEAAHVQGEPASAKAEAAPVKPEVAPVKPEAALVKPEVAPAPK